MAGNSFIFPERMLDAVPRSRLLSRYPASEEGVKLLDIHRLTDGLERLFGRFSFFSERALDVILQREFLRKCPIIKENSPNTALGINDYAVLGSSRLAVSVILTYARS